MSTNITVITSNESFAIEVVQAQLPVLVDFSASWCGPCRMFFPILETIANKYVGQVKVVKVDIDDCSEIAEQYNIRGVPTIILFKDGKEVAQKVGGLSETQLIDFLSNHL